MSKLFYCKLALTNLRKNNQTYTPYIITCVCSVMMFYNICSLTFHDATGHGNVSAFMTIGMWVTAIFLAIFLYYTNSFLVKRRKKEFGLFNILGMEKKHIGKVMFWETAFTSVFSLAVGLLLGMVFSKLFILLLYKILKFTPKYDFEISGRAVIVTLVLFVVIFAVTLIKNLCQVHLAKPVELLNGGNVGEREPKTKWLLTIIGVLTLGAGYTIALTIKTPLQAITMFFVAVILVIIGTYCLFTAGSIALLKLLKKNKGYFYQTKHFTSVSGMIYRMKQNAVGLANICIMSTAVLVMISTTVSLYAGMNDILSNSFPTDIGTEIYFPTENKPDKEKYISLIEKAGSDDGIKISDITTMTYIEYACNIEGDSLVSGSEFVTIDTMSAALIITVEQYEEKTGIAAQISDGEILLYCDEVTFDSKLNMFGRSYVIKSTLESSPVPKSAEYDAWGASYLCIVTTSGDFDTICNAIRAEYTSGTGLPRLSIRFNTDSAYEVEIAFAEKLRGVLLDNGASEGDGYCYVGARSDAEASFYEIYGGLFFLGIFLGAIFLMATVLIIYYKQVVEGFDDKERFNIMQKVGMSRAEVRKSIRSQVLTVFLLPVLAAIVHIIVAFPILTKLLAILGLVNVSLFVWCLIATVAVFILIYVIVYLMTARVYYKIIDGRAA